MINRKNNHSTFRRIHDYNKKRKNDKTQTDNQNLLAQGLAHSKY